MIRSLCVGLVVISLTSCASITGSNTQSITVLAVCGGSAVAKGATCILSNDQGQWFLSTPGAVVVGKSGSDLKIRCEKGGSSGELTLRSSANSNMVGNVLIGGPIGAVMDASSGSGFDYPKTATVSLYPSCSNR